MKTGHKNLRDCPSGKPIVFPEKSDILLDDVYEMIISRGWDGLFEIYRYDDPGGCMVVKKRIDGQKGLMVAKGHVPKSPGTIKRPRYNEFPPTSEALYPLARKGEQ